MAQDYLPIPATSVSVDMCSRSPDISAVICEVIEGKYYQDGPAYEGMDRQWSI